MAMDKTDKNPLDGIKWKTEIIAEDEISELVKKTAKIEASEDFQAAFSRVRQNNFFDYIRKLIKTCDDILREDGWPETWQRIWTHPLEGWEPVKPDDEMRYRPWSNQLAALWVQEQTADLSDAWYAARIGFKSLLYLEHIDNGHADRHDIHSMAFEIASLRTDWEWRSKQKPSILTGRKQRKTLADHRGKANEKQSEGVLARRAAIATILSTMNRNLTGGGLEKYLCTELMGRFQIKASQRTIRRDLSQISRP